MPTSSSTVGRVIDSNIQALHFESSQWDFLIGPVHISNIEKTKITERGPS